MGINDPSENQLPACPWCSAIPSERLDDPVASADGSRFWDIHHKPDCFLAVDGAFCIMDEEEIEAWSHRTASAGTENDAIVAEAQRLYEATTRGEWHNEGDFLADENTVVVGSESYNWRMVAHTNSDIDENGEKGTPDIPQIDKAEAKANADWLAYIHNHWPEFYAMLGGKK